MLNAAETVPPSHRRREAFGAVPVLFPEIFEALKETGGNAAAGIVPAHQRDDAGDILAATIESKADTEKVLAAGEKLVADRNAEIDAMHPSAKAAVLRDLENHPEKVIRTVTKREGWKVYNLNALNKIDSGSDLEIISPTILSKIVKGSEYEFVTPKTGEKLDWVNADHDCAIYTPLEIEEGTLVRMKDEDFVEGKIRDTGR